MYRWLNLVFSLNLLFSPLSVPVSGPAPLPPGQDITVNALLEAMTPAEKVGQLFIVGFYGTSTGEGSDIHRLITEYHVGGVVLAAATDNITDTLQAPAQVLTVTNALQAAALQASLVARPGPAPSEGDLAPAPYIPLFVAVNHEGNGYPFTEIQSGLTDVPSAMAIGATWDPSHAESMGRIVGAELSALGINFLLGPSLDVLETPRPDGADLGTRVFGGDPYWVGVIGEAYIRGVHFGSADRVAVIAKHFPGTGGSDRQPDFELPTVRKSIEDLKSFDLVPFFQVVDGAPAEAGPSDGVADGLLAAHIRFQGFQGQIRQVTPPVSFDAQAFGQLLALPELAAWRAGGGVTVSDSLGARAVKQFYDPTETEFPYRRISSGAFNAGNDLMLLTDYGINPRVEQTANIVDTLIYFQQQYASDPSFAARVDAAAARILSLKLRLNGNAFAPEAAVLPHAGLDVLQRDQDDVLALAQAAAALVSPSTLEELEARAPEPPLPTERIVFFTDVRQGQQCSTCLRYPLLEERRLEDEVLARYGPNGTGQVRTSNLQSYSFDELATYLNQPTSPAAGDETPTPTPSVVQAAIESADWIVLNMVNVSADVPSSSIVSDFLAQRPDIVRSKRVVVFAFDAPYYLDTTDLSKLTAFYALYSHTPQFVTVAARLLFRNVTPNTAPPVSVSAIGYDLIRITRPDPDRLIELFWQKATPSATDGPLTTLQLGDAITLTTGILIDQNGHQVPDETPVTFRVFYQEEGLPEFFTAPTSGGVASIVLQLNRQGRLQITASSEPALLSGLLEIPVQEDPFSVTKIVPTPMPTDTPQPTATAIPSTATHTPTATATVVIPPPPQPRVDLRGFFVMCLGLGAALVGGYRLGNNPETQRRQGVRVALAGAIGLLLAYNYVALGLPGAEGSFDSLGMLAAPIWGIIGGVVGVAAGWFWFVGRRRT